MTSRELLVSLRATIAQEGLAPLLFAELRQGALVVRAAGPGAEPVAVTHAANRDGLRKARRWVEGYLAATRDLDLSAWRAGWHDAPLGQALYE